MDLREKALAVFTVIGIVVAFAYFSVPLAALAGVATFPFVLMVLVQ
jgi:hypothetical protein